MVTKWHSKRFISKLKYHTFQENFYTISPKIFGEPYAGWSVTISWWPEHWDWCTVLPVYSVTVSQSHLTPGLMNNEACLTFSYIFIQLNALWINLYKLSGVCPPPCLGYYLCVAANNSLCSLHRLAVTAATLLHSLGWCPAQITS